MTFLAKIHAWLMPAGVSLAWRQLNGDKKRFITAVAGVSFGVVIMLFQVGIFQAFMRMVCRPLEAVGGDLVMVSREFMYFMSAGEFPERRLYQTLADSEVEALYPLAVSFQRWRNPENGSKLDTAVIGVHAGRNPFVIPELASRSDVLALPDGLLFDDQSAPLYGNVSEVLRQQGEFFTEVGRKRVRVCGTFSMGQTLATYGNVVTGMETFQRVTGQLSGIINYGLIRLKPGSDPVLAAGRLQKLLPDDVEIITREEWTRREQVYWQENTPIGFIVGAGIVLAMFVGAVIVYQILYTDINDHMKEYATLKAIGFSQGFFAKFILSQSLILLCLGFIPGLLVTAPLFMIADSDADLPTRLTVPDSLLVFVLTGAMCLISGFLAIRRLRSVDPADLF